MSISKKAFPFPHNFNFQTISISTRIFSDRDIPLQITSYPPENTEIDVSRETESIGGPEKNV